MQSSPNPQETDDQPAPIPSGARVTPLPTSPPPKQNQSNKPIIIAVAVLIVVLLGLGIWHLTQNKDIKSTASTTDQPKAATKDQEAQTNASAAQGLKLDTSKNYGNKYANGLLPVGDGKYVTDGPKQGYIYTCSGYANNIKVESGGAGKRGPWFTNNNTQYNLNAKLHVQGSVMWQPSFSNTLSGNARVIVTNDLPSHPTGTFPIAAADPAYAYDRNPNSIKNQNLTYSLSSSPTYNAAPNCMGGQAGIMLSGVALFNGFDAGGRDAGAWEIQDSCAGHPQSGGEYHYHTLSSCIKDINVKTVIGYALDGFPITGPQVNSNSILTTSDLDECHGLTSQVVVDGKTLTTYHYVMTQDFPYSVSCFRGTAIEPPGQKPLPH